MSEKTKAAKIISVFMGLMVITLFVVGIACLFGALSSFYSGEFQIGLTRTFGMALAFIIATGWSKQVEKMRTPKPATQNNNNKK